MSTNSYVPSSLGQTLSHIRKTCAFDGWSNFSIRMIDAGILTWKGSHPLYRKTDKRLRKLSDVSKVISYIANLGPKFQFSDI